MPHTAASYICSPQKAPSHCHRLHPICREAAVAGVKCTELKGEASRPPLLPQAFSQGHQWCCQCTEHSELAVLGNSVSDLREPELLESHRGDGSGQHGVRCSDVTPASPHKEEFPHAAHSHDQVLFFLEQGKFHDETLE